jgi:hypothetical protein
MVVERIHQRITVEKAAEMGILEMKDLKEEGVLHILTMDKLGNCAGVTNKSGLFHYYADSSSEKPTKRASTFVEL